MNKTFSILLLAGGIGGLWWWMSKSKSWDAQIAAANNLSQLEIIRNGANGFETLYLTGKMEYTEYMRLYNIYLTRYYAIAGGSAFPVNPIPYQGLGPW